MIDNLFAQIEQLPDALAGHLVISVVPLALAVLVSVPLGVVVVGRPRFRGPLLTVVGLIQTIPGLALLALMVPVLVGVGEVLAPLGIDVPALGPLPVLIALTLYAMLPIVRNTVTGIEGLEPGLIEAARAIGMTDGQIRVQVQLPLAAPIILAGIRTAAVWVVGMGTLATPVGQTSLGNFIFSGLQTSNVIAVLVGCLGAAGLAIVVDGVLAVVERAVAARQPRLAAGAVLGLGGLVVAGVLAPVLLRPADSGRSVVVASKPFTEQFVLAQLLDDRLSEAGFATRQLQGLGSAVVLNALLAGEIDVYVDYTGTLWVNQLKRTDTAPAEVVERRVCDWLAEKGATCIGTLGFENAYALAVRQTDARSKGWASIGDLAGAEGLSLGADYEFLQRPEWEAVRSAYGLSFPTTRTFDATFLYEAAGSGQVDVISAYTSDGRIAAFDLTTLDDPEGALPPYDALVVAAPGVAPGVLDALRPLVGRISVQDMREANRRVDVAGDSVSAAAAWLGRAIQDPQGGTP